MTGLPPIPEPIYRIDGYPALIGALIERKHQLKLRNLDVDERGDLPSGYFGKLCSGLRSASVVSLGKALWALDMVLVAFPSDDPYLLAYAKQVGKPIPIKQLDKKGKNICLAAMSRKGGVKRALLTSPAKRKAIARRAAKKRAAKLSAERRKEIGKQAIAARWAKRQRLVEAYSRAAALAADGRSNRPSCPSGKSAATVSPQRSSRPPNPFPSTPSQS